MDVSGLGDPKNITNVDKCQRSLRARFFLQKTHTGHNRTSHFFHVYPLLLMFFVGDGSVSIRGHNCHGLSWVPGSGLQQPSGSRPTRWPDLVSKKGVHFLMKPWKFKPHELGEYGGIMKYFHVIHPRNHGISFPAFMRAYACTGFATVSCV